MTSEHDRPASGDAASQLPPEPQASTAEVTVLREQVSSLALQIAQLTQMMTAGGKLSAAQFTAGPGISHTGAPLPGMPLGYPAQMNLGGPAPSMPQGYDYYVRIKPYDPGRKQLRKRQYFDEIGRVLVGGSGKPGDVPEWAPVTVEQAMQLQRHLQLPEDPMSPLVLDIVTPEERAAIDASEAQVRAHSLGLAGMTPTNVLAAMNRPGMVTARVSQGNRHVKPATPTAVQQSSSLMAGTMEYQQAQAQLAAAQRVLSAPPAPARAGRAAALEMAADALPGEAPLPLPAGVPLPPAAPAPEFVPPPPMAVSSVRGVSEDLTAEAAYSQDAAEAIAAAAPHVSRRGRPTPQ